MGLTQRRQFEPRLAGIEQLGKDGKTWLQEYAQGKGWPSPQYEGTADDGPPHERTFEVAVSVGGKEYRGRGKSKQEAEQRAAEAAGAGLREKE
jgi:ribonuclease-3